MGGTHITGPSGFVKSLHSLSSGRLVADHTQDSEAIEKVINRYDIDSSPSPKKQKGLNESSIGENVNDSMGADINNINLDFK